MMKVVIVTVCVCISVCAGSRGLRGPLNNNNLPGGGIGLRDPPAGCAMTMDQFRAEVEGKTYITIYGINGDDALFGDKSLKFKVQWNENADGTINRAGSYWNEANGECDNFASNFQPVPGNIARWRIANTENDDTFFADNRQDTLISCDPSRYIIFNICYDTTGIVGGKCPISETLLVVPEQRPDVDVNNDGIPDGDAIFNNIPWCSAEKKSVRCLGETFVNNDALGWEWYWTGQECPFVRV